MDWNTFFYHPVDQPNYFVVEVKEKKITVKTIKQDGTIIDVFFIDKAKDVSSDTPRATGNRSSGVRKNAPHDRDADTLSRSGFGGGSMADYQTLQTKLHELAGRKWDLPAIEARCRILDQHRESPEKN